MRGGRVQKDEAAKTKFFFWQGVTQVEAERAHA